MNISVIIPVYNAAKYVQKAVESALQQEETGEVLLIEDNSPDNSLKICADLQKKHSKVRLLRHPDGKNKGASQSRNLGICNAQCEFIAFLDADDYYLPNRFSTSKFILSIDQTLDGVYEAIGMHFYDSIAKEQWISRGGELLTTLNKRIQPEKLFDALMIGNAGYIHLDGLVVKKELFDSSGLFLDNLRLHQDTAIILQLSLFGRLAPGNLETPVALRGIHSDNRITKNKDIFYTHSLLWSAMLNWGQSKGLTAHQLGLIYKKHIEAQYHKLKKDACGTNSNLSSRFSLLFHEFVMHPVLFSTAALDHIDSGIKRFFQK